MHKLITYTDVSGADEIVRTHFRQYDDFRIYWEALTEDDKYGYLVKSTDQIRSVVFHGAYEPSNSTIIKKACVYNALGFMNEDLKATAEKQTQVFKSMGVMKNPRLDQTSVRAIVSEGKAEDKPKAPIMSVIAYSLLEPYRHCYIAYKGVII